MHALLEFPFDSDIILQKQKRIRRELLEQGNLDTKKIAILGGSTISEIKNILELFLLNYGILPEFYESEYGLYWEEAVFENEYLEKWKPDIVFIHTCNRNIKQMPSVMDSSETVQSIIETEYNRFKKMWESLEERYHCIIIQNNFEMPFYRLYGNQDACNIHGRSYVINELNRLFSQYALEKKNFYIHDINYLSAVYGIKRWSNPTYWYMYKYALEVPAIPSFCYSLANIIKSIYGKNKKVLMLDLDNILWGGVIGEDGIEHIEIGAETSVGQAYYEFQEYVKKLSEMGVVLTINSKNDYENALLGLNHPDGVLGKDDFAIIMANWDNKDVNALKTAEALDLSTDSFVFVDDNPVERALVKNGIEGIMVPDIDKIEKAVRMIDEAGYFEKTLLSDEDYERNNMYKHKVERETIKQSIMDYTTYLKSLKMHAVIRPFEDAYMSRIAQLTNKSNQFNLTTKRYTEAEIKQISTREDSICLYGRLSDRFGDEGIVSVVIGFIDGEELKIQLWLMSCRVLKRNMEMAMMDSLVQAARNYGIQRIRGYYYKTKKNAMVKDFYGNFGFEKVAELENGDSEWMIETKAYTYCNEYITVEGV